MAGNTIRLRLDLGLNQEFAAAVGVFPIGTQIFYTTEDGTEDRYTVRGFVPTEDPFDMPRQLRSSGRRLNFITARIYSLPPALNQRADR